MNILKVRLQQPGKTGALKNFETRRREDYEAHEETCNLLHVLRISPRLRVSIHFLQNTIHFVYPHIYAALS